MKGAALLALSRSGSSDKSTKKNNAVKKTITTPRRDLRPRYNIDPDDRRATIRMASCQCRGSTCAHRVARGLGL